MSNSTVYWHYSKEYMFHTNSGGNEISYVIATAGDLDQDEGITLDNITANSADLQVSGSYQVQPLPHCI